MTFADGEKETLNIKRITNNRLELEEYGESLSFGRERPLNNTSLAGGKFIHKEDGVEMVFEKDGTYKLEYEGKVSKGKWLVEKANRRIKISYPDLSLVKHDMGDLTKDHYFEVIRFNYLVMHFSFAGDSDYYLDRELSAQ